MTQELHRARLPLEIYPISAGVKGGLAGSVAMAVLAVLYGIISGHGVWYPINLLSAGFFPARSTIAQIATFHWDALIIATVLHLMCSVLVGLLYGAALPMFPRRPILLGGVIAPVLWSGLIHGILDAVDPVLNQWIDWLWFVISQIGFGIVAGFVVSKQARVRTWQYLPLAVRAGIEAAGAIDEKNGDSDQQ
jgi:formate-dependent nitrite reductase membrane component NrfD